MDVLIAEDLYTRAEPLWAASGHRFHRADGKDEGAMAKAFAAGGIRALIIGTKKYSDAFYEGMPEGTLVQRFGVGFDSVPLELCKRKKIRVGYTPGTLDAAVAEHTLALLLSIAHQIPAAHADLTGGTWQGRAGLQVAGKTLALLGFGPIARRVARMAKRGLEMRVQVYNNFGEIPKSEQQDIDALFGDLAPALEGADFVSMHLRAVDPTRHFIRAETLARFKPGAVFLNTARGSLVNEGDLFDAIASGRLGGAALDVFEKEPYEPQGGKDLRKLRQVVLTPHVGSNSDGANRAMAESCLKNLAALEAGGPLTLVPGS
ncbi:MAG: hydroxyacid dehydrogenase [Spirochaetes bacterium]|nr:hydroxyacid dehydrogenase [Spirochaetota bacterium]